MGSQGVGWSQRSLSKDVGEGTHVHTLRRFRQQLPPVRPLVRVAASVAHRACSEAVRRIEGAGGDGGAAEGCGGGESCAVVVRPLRPPAS